MAQRREHPYIWATWLPRLLTGEHSCEWAIWFKAHHQNWIKVPSDFNQAEWMLNPHLTAQREEEPVGSPPPTRVRRRSEQLPSARAISHAGWPARPDRSAEQ